MKVTEKSAILVHAQEKFPAINWETKNETLGEPRSILSDVLIQLIVDALETKAIELQTSFDPATLGGVYAKFKIKPKHSDAVGYYHIKDSDHFLNVYGQGPQTVSYDIEVAEGSISLKPAWFYNPSNVALIAEGRGSGTIAAGVAHPGDFPKPDLPVFSDIVECQNLVMTDDFFIDTSLKFKSVFVWAKNLPKFMLNVEAQEVLDKQISSEQAVIAAAQAEVNIFEKMKLSLL